MRLANLRQLPLGAAVAEDLVRGHVGALQKIGPLAVEERLPVFTVNQENDTKETRMKTR